MWVGSRRDDPARVPSPHHARGSRSQGSGAKLASLIPQYTARRWTTWSTALGSPAGRSLGLQPEQVLARAATQTLDLNRLTDLADRTRRRNVLGVLSTLVFVAVIVLFIGFDSTRFPRNLFAARGERPAVVDALTAFAKGHPDLPPRSPRSSASSSPSSTRSALTLLGVPGAVGLGRARLRHELHPQHRVHHRGHPAGRHRPPRRRPRPHDRP